MPSRYGRFLEAFLTSQASQGTEADAFASERSPPREIPFILWKHTLPRQPGTNASSRPAPQFGCAERDCEEVMRDCPSFTDQGVWILQASGKWGQTVGGV